MNYFISREGKEYGPYTLADLQRYLASGHVLITDLTRSEGMTTWTPVSQVVGNIPVPLVTAPVQPAGPPVVDFPAPPALHWAVVLVIGIFTCNFFTLAWGIVQSAFVKRIEPKSKSLYCYIGSIAAVVLYIVLSAMDVVSELVFLAWIASIGLWIISGFVLRSELEEHYNTSEPISLDLSGIMTFFFNVFYFQYHLYRIAELKRTTQLSVVPLEV